MFSIPRAITEEVCLSSRRLPLRPHRNPAPVGVVRLLPWKPVTNHRPGWHGRAAWAGALLAAVMGGRSDPGAGEVTAGGREGAVAWLRPGWVCRTTAPQWSSSLVAAVPLPAALGSFPWSRSVVSHVGSWSLFCASCHTMRTERQRCSTAALRRAGSRGSGIADCEMMLFCTLRKSDFH